MRRLMLAVLVSAFALGTTASAAPCRNDKGKFVTCPPTKAKKCRDDNGRFVKCQGLPGKT